MDGTSAMQFLRQKIIRSADHKGGFYEKDSIIRIGGLSGVLGSDPGATSRRAEKEFFDDAFVWAIGVRKRILNLKPLKRRGSLACF